MYISHKLRNFCILILLNIIAYIFLSFFVEFYNMTIENGFTNCLNTLFFDELQYNKYQIYYFTQQNHQNIYALINSLKTAHRFI